AIYFKATWKTPFFVKSTELEGQFRVTSGEVVKTPLMISTRDVPYFEHSGTKAVLLDYKESNLAMVLILPPEDIPLGTFIKSHLTPQSLRTLLHNLQREQ